MDRVSSEKTGNDGFAQGWILAILALLAIAAYLPILTQPFISDDYAVIRQARVYGPVSGWPAMLGDPVNRVRAAYWFLTYWTERLFGLWPAAFYGVSLALHILNTWLVYALGNWRAIGWRISAFAAAFFAVCEVHQEAVMWYSASSELLLFGFGMLFLLGWIAFVQAPEIRPGLYAGTVAALLFALVTKESAVILVALAFLPVVVEPGKWRRMVWLVPFVAIVGFFVWSVFHSSQSNFRFQDGSFSLHAPFWITWPSSFWRLFWPWGLLGLMTMAALKEQRWRRTVAIGFAWAGISLLPYSFLTYMTRVPSRQTYLASAGIAFIVAAGFASFQDRFAIPHRRWVYGLAALIVLHNCIYLWTKKRGEFMGRGASTQSLVEFVRRTDGPVRIPCSPSTGWKGCDCFPYSPLVAESAVELEAGKPSSVLVWSEEAQPAATTFCWRQP
jgi:hypothetical protein